MVQSIYSKNESLFDSFPKYDLKHSCFNYNSNNLNQKNTEDKINLSNKKITSKKKKILFGSTIASSIITAGIIGLVAAKGFHGSSLLKLNEKLTNELQNANLEMTKDIADTGAYYAKKGTKKSLALLNALSNFTAVKDSICDKIFKTNKATEKFADGTRKGFKKIAERTLNQKYDKVGVKVDNLTSLLKKYNIKNLSNLSEAQKAEEVTIKGITKSLGEWIEALSIQTDKLETAYQDGFSLGARKLRGQKRNSMLADVPKKINERFFKNNGLFKLKNYKKYATEEVSNSARKELKSDILSAKKKVTNNIPSIHEHIKEKLAHFAETIKPSDKESKQSIQLLKQNLEKFKSCSGADETELRNKISEEISIVIDNAVSAIKKGSSYSEAEQTELLKQLAGIKKSILSADNMSKGAIEEIMTILKGLNTQNISSTNKKIISDAEFKEFSKLSSGIRKGLDKASNSEAGEYFIKQAELEVGSAATDVLSLLFPIGAGAYAISKGENKDEKISAVLTTCLPLVGTFATFTYGTVKMLTGAKNLMFSLAAGFVLNKFGNYCNKLYQKYKKTGSVTEVAKDEYKELLNDTSFKPDDKSV